MERPASSADPPSSIPFPDISKEQTFFDIVSALATYISSLIVTPHTFEDLRVGEGNYLLAPITEHLGANCQQPEIVAALLALKWHYGLDPDDRGIMQTRGWACEIIAWRHLSYLSEYDVLDFLLFEVKSRRTSNRTRASTWFRSSSRTPSESSNLLSRNISPTPPPVEEVEDEGLDPTTRFAGLNALEIAAVAEAKKFLAQRSVQRIVGAIWRGDIIFWPALSVTTTKKPQRYNPHRADPYSRLRVPLYQKVFEALFFASFLALYYAVLLERHPERITPIEILLYVWIAAFAYDEFGELRDTGSLFYAADVWNLWDACIVLVALIFLVLRIVGLVKGDSVLLDVSFDVLSLEALFLVPRLCSMLSVHPYFGTLIPCLKEMVKDFIKFLSVVIILYLGFLTTFAMLARDTFTIQHISWTLVYVFFGSSYLGFEAASKISPMLGPPLMIVFVALTNILLLTSLISLLSNSLTKVMDHAREEYLFQYSLFVLEASASRRLTYYLPPLNLIPLILFRPLRPCVHQDTLRYLRITTLKATHWPFVLMIKVFESAPSPKSWLAWCTGRNFDNHDEEVYSNLGPPRPLGSGNVSRSVSAGASEANGKKTSKNWQLNLQPRQSHRRNFSATHILSLAATGTNSSTSTSNGRGGGSLRDMKKQREIQTTLRRYDTTDQRNTGARSHADIDLDTDDVSASGKKHISRHELHDLKQSIIHLESMVKQLLAKQTEGHGVEIEANSQGVGDALLIDDEG